MSSSSSESENEELKKFAAAVDSSLFNNEFYKPENERKVDEEKKELKSNRFLDNTENIFQSELTVSENMKEFIGKKMSKLIDDSIEFVDVRNDQKSRKTVDRIKLLKGSKEFITLDQTDQLDYPKCKIPIKRRKVDDDELKESSKIDVCATDVCKITQEVNLWDNKHRHKTIKYKKHSKNEKVCHKIEEPNEFAAIRNRNKWDESKIKDSKYFNKGLGSIINSKLL